MFHPLRHPLAAIELSVIRIHNNSSTPHQSCRVCFQLIGALLALLLLFLATVVGLFFQTRFSAILFGVLGVLLLTAIWATVRLRREVTRKLILPLSKVIDWSKKMAEGDLEKRIEPDPAMGYPQLIQNINHVSARINRLTHDMHAEVDAQTARIAQKNHALEVLYDVAASINISKSLEDLLLRFLPTLRDVLHAEAATVRLSNYDGQMRLIGSVGLEQSTDEIKTLIPVLHCMYGSELQEGELLSKDMILHCEIYPGQPFYGQTDIEMIAVPLQYRDKNLGVYNLFVKRPSLLDREDIKELLISIGRHLGIAIEKAHTEDESKRLSLYRERSQLSHELHDSLAQTVAALKFQVSTLHDSLAQSDHLAALKEAGQLRNGLDEAYTELRELIAHFRAPFDERGLVSALDTLIQQFRDTSKILIYFQNQWRDAQLTTLQEIQVLRIIQESLNNIKKHSQAHSVRILLSYDNDRRSVLVEDDGVGIGQPVLGGHPGEQVGLSIMRERAHRIGGELSIESEPGEGTQIKLTFPPASDNNNETQKS